MRSSLNIDKLLKVYAGVSSRYDLQHGLLTAFSDERGRKALVKNSVSPGKIILDCGAGTGSLSLYASELMKGKGKIFLFDLSKEMLLKAKEKFNSSAAKSIANFSVGDMLKLPYSDSSFDVVLSSYSLCPVYDPVRGVKEMLRVLKPGGLIAIAHSSEPDNKINKKIADAIENIVWRFPSLSLGCRAVNVLPALEEMGVTIIYKKKIGIPYWPFLIFVGKYDR